MSIDLGQELAHTLRQLTIRWMQKLKDAVNHFQRLQPFLSDLLHRFVVLILIYGTLIAEISLLIDCEQQIAEHIVVLKLVQEKKCVSIRW